MAIALVTGTSTGIGQATAVTLARAGHTVYASMRNPATGGTEIQGIAAAEKLPLTVVLLDVDNEASVEAAVRDVLARSGQIDVLVNNAGLGSSGAVEETPIEEYRRVMETNFFGALRCIRAVVPGMRERRSGCIVNVTSVAGRVSGPAHSPYTASKWALEALSESLACEMKAFGVRVAVVEPGVIATPIFGKRKEPEKPSIYPYGRRMHALFAALLKNPVSPYAVGECIREIVDGGTWQLRHPVGPDAAPLLAMRSKIADEEWIAAAAVTDEEWKDRMKRSMGLEVEL